jgi:two-component response regulator (ARR-B family)
VDGEKETIIKGIAHGACDYMVKPVSLKKLKNIWQHVVRKNLRAMNHDSSSDSDDADQMEVKPVIVEGERGYAKCKSCSKKMKNDADSSDENKECMGVPTTQKKPRVSWTGELHRRFLEVVDQLGESKGSQLFFISYSPNQILCFLDLFSVTKKF